MEKRRGRREIEVTRRLKSKTWEHQKTPDSREH